MKQKTYNYKTYDKCNQNRLKFHFFSESPDYDFTHTKTQGENAWWLLTLSRVSLIREIRIYNRLSIPSRIDGVKIWVGKGLTGGNYDGANNVGTVYFQTGRNPYIFPNLNLDGSSVQVQGGDSYVTLSEVEVYSPTPG